MLSEVSEWKLESADEDNDRYFFHVDDVKMIDSGNRVFVIGRKGTGKTAICKHIENNSTYSKFTHKLSFKNFPFNELYKLSDSSFTRPSQYTSLWKYIIYSFICRSMVKNQAIKSEIRLKLEKLYPSNGEANFDRLIRSWTSAEFGVQVLGTGLSGKIDRENKNLYENWFELVAALEDVIKQNIDDSKYYILFDELDEDYKDYWVEDRRKEYLDLITSLFKAVQSVRQIFRNDGSNIFPIIFLRDDIYELLQDPDKTKWRDSLISLDWKRDDIKRLLGFRLSRSISRDEDILPFEQAWKIAFKNGDMGYGTRQRKRTSQFNFIAKATHMRPRDFIFYIRECARSAQQQGHRAITSDTIKNADKEFSNYFKEELTGEIESIVPNISQIFDLLSENRKSVLSYSELRRTFEEGCRRGGYGKEIIELGIDNILKILFHFSVVGNQPNQTRREPIFKFSNRGAVLSRREPIIVHRGLLKSLDIV